MSTTTIHGEELMLRGTQPMRLDEPGRLWWVRDGGLVVFAAELVGGEPVGRRHFMFHAGPGQAIFGLAGTDRFVLIAQAVGEARLVAGHSADLSSAFLQGDAEAVEMLGRWACLLATHFADRPAPANAELVSGEGTLALSAGTAMRTAAGSIAWLAVKEGRLRVRGDEDVVVDAASGLILMPDALWMQAEGPCKVELISVARAAQGGLDTCLAQYHKLVMVSLQDAVGDHLAANRQRFFDRAERDAAVTTGVIQDLTSLIKANVPETPTSNDPLMAALHVLGERLGIAMQPPSPSEDMARVKDPVEAIARASRFRYRQVLLAPPWWQRDNGPLLAYLADGHHPVALLPKPGAKYELYDPRTGSYAPVDEALAATLEPFALMLYRSLPGRALKAFDIVLFALHGRERDLIMMMVMGIVGSLVGMVSPQITGMLIDQAIPDSNRTLLLEMGAALGFSTLGGITFSICQGLLMQRVEAQADAATQAAIWDRVLNLGAPFFRRFDVGDLSQRIMAISQIRQHLSGAVLHSLLSSLFALLNLGLMISYSPQLTGVAVTLTVVMMVVTALHTSQKQKRFPRMQQIDADMFGMTVQLLNGVAKLRVTGSEGRAFAKWGRKLHESVKLKREIQGIENSLSVISTIVPTLGTVALFYVAATSAGLSIQGHSGNLSTGTFLAFNAAFGTFMGGMLGLSGMALGLLDLRTLWNRALPIIHEPPETREGSLDPGRLKGHLSLEKVTFRYVQGGKTILDGISLHAAPGEHIALVGSSGCGKSTIFRLLLGFEKAEAGMVTFDGQDLASLDMRAVRRQMGVVLQNGKLQAGSVFDAIACGANLSHTDAWDAARCAGFDKDIEAMPMGMHTVVAEGGGNLSGGQRQRLMIARAFALKPRVMLFDEATSALDNTTQAIVSESMARMQVTRIAIAHRLSTIQDADRIYVFDQGRIIQVGTYDELCAQDGMFADMVGRQVL
ncbi:MAG: bacteriocin system transporter, ATP-binding protein [Cyanobacteria bacterium RYN_339]|nr:bacteriocin system transporter, ATP-binding protein [Cyanobacteria bacterium RYN_339]